MLYRNYFSSYYRKGWKYIPNGLVHLSYIVSTCLHCNKDCWKAWVLIACWRRQIKVLSLLHFELRAYKISDEFSVLIFYLFHILFQTRKDGCVNRYNNNDMSSFFQQKADIWEGCIIQWNTRRTCQVYYSFKFICSKNFIKLE